MNKVRVKRYDQYILESFKMGIGIGDVYRDVNKQQIANKEPPLVSRSTMWRMYDKWAKAGKPGELESKRITNDIGEIVVVWRLKNKG